MINIIATFEPKAALDQSLLDEFTAAGCAWVMAIPEMQVINGAIPLQCVVPNMATFTSFKSILDGLDNRGATQIIGIWNDDGTQYANSPYPFDINAYTTLLNPICTYDALGNVISSARPTVAQAESIQVNCFSGMPPRILS